LTAACATILKRRVAGDKLRIGHGGFCDVDLDVLATHVEHMSWNDSGELGNRLAVRRSLIEISVSIPLTKSVRVKTSGVVL
jgi:hypothetical protein